MLNPTMLFIDGKLKTTHAFVIKFNISYISLDNLGFVYKTHFY